MMSGGGMRLRAMGVGDVLDETFRLYRRHFLSFVIATAVAAVPVSLLAAAFSVAIGVGSRSFEIRTVDDITAALLFAIVAVSVGLISGLVYTLSGAAVIRLAADAVLGRPLDVGAAYRAGLARLGSVLWAGFLLTLALGLLVITCVGVPIAVFLGAGWAVCYPAIVLEGMGGGGALRRSSTLVEGHRWRVLGTVLVMSILVWILVSVPTGLVGVIMSLIITVAEPGTAGDAAVQVVNAFVSAISQSLFGGLSWISVTLIYYELRVRKEAFDLEQLASEGDVPPASLPPSATPARPTVPPPPSPMAPPPHDP